MTCTAALTVAGLISGLTGVLLLFRYGMPYRIPSTNGDYIVTQQADPEGLKLDARYKRLGVIGLILTILGALLQSAAALLGG